MSKNVLILGGNSDIAKACANLFYKKRYTITLASRNIVGMSTYCKEQSIEANILHFDALDYQNHNAFYNTLEIKPNIIICAFGYLAKNLNAFQNFDETEKIIDINFKGAISILNVIAQDFEKKKTGTIIGISSVAADRGKASSLIYSAAKAGFDSYITGLRNKLYSSGVKVITIRPGYVKTKMIDGIKTPSFLTTSPEQIANRIYKSYLKKRNIVYSDFKWRLIMLIIKSTPEWIFKRLKL